MRPSELRTARAPRHGKPCENTRAMQRHVNAGRIARTARVWACESDGQGLCANMNATIVGLLGEHAKINGTKVKLIRWEPFSQGWEVQDGEGRELWMRPQKLLADTEEWEDLNEWRKRRRVDTDEVQQHEESDALLHLTCDVSTDDEADSESDAESEEERPPTHTHSSASVRGAR